MLHGNTMWKKTTYLIAETKKTFFMVLVVPSERIVRSDSEILPSLDDQLKPCDLNVVHRQFDLCLP